MSSKQTTSSSLTPFYEMKLDFNLVSSTRGAITYVTDYQKKANEIFKFVVKNQRVTSIKPNPKIWSLYKINSVSSNNVLLGDNFITEFIFNGSVSTKITESNIDVVVPYGTDLKALKAIFTLSNGAIVKIGSITQITGFTVNNFTGPVIYTVVSANGMTQNYIVNVTVAKNTEKQITTFSFNGFNPLVTATIIGTTITATVPFGADLTKLVATFTTSAKAIVTVGQTEQVSGTTTNDFTKLVTYTVTAEDGTTQNYVINISVESDKKAGISILTKNNLIYPNPNNGEFFISAQHGDLKIEIKDLEGRVVYSNSILNYQGDKITIDLKEYSTSVYIINILNNNTETISKIEVLK